MSTGPLQIPETCAASLAAIETDPMDPGPEAEMHLQVCRACSEARVFYLAQEESPEALAPAGYFERLPGRVLRKLPARPSLHHRMGPLAWAAAAAVLMAVGTGAFLVGRANRTPYIEATLPRQQDQLETSASDLPFHNHEEEAAQVQALSPEDMKALLKRLDSSPSSPR